MPEAVAPARTQPAQELPSREDASPVQNGCGQEMEKTSLPAAGSEPGSARDTPTPRQPTEGKSTGMVKWFNCKRNFGFIKITLRAGASEEADSEKTEEDVFLHGSSIMKKNPRKFGRTVDEGEMVEFDLVESTKGREAIHVTGIGGQSVKGSRYDANRYPRRGFRQRFPSRLPRQQQANSASDEAETGTETSPGQHSTATGNDSDQSSGNQQRRQNKRRRNRSRRTGNSEREQAPAENGTADHITEQEQQQPREQLQQQQQQQQQRSSRQNGNQYRGDQLQDQRMQHSGGQRQRRGGGGGAGGGGGQQRVSYQQRRQNRYQYGGPDIYYVVRPGQRPRQYLPRYEQQSRDSFFERNQPLNMGAQRGARRQGQRMNGAPRPRNNDRDREAVKPERERKPRPSGNSDRHVDRGNARTTSHVENDYPTRGPTSNGTFQQHSHITSSAHLPAMAD